MILFYWTVKSVFLSILRKKKMTRKLKRVFVNLYVSVRSGSALVTEHVFSMRLNESWESHISREIGFHFWLDIGNEFHVAVMSTGTIDEFL